MRGISARKTILLALVLVALASAFHGYIRLSPAYASAVAAYKRQNVSEADAGFSLCFSCSKRLSYGNGIWYYRFTLIVRKGSATRQIPVCIRSRSGRDDDVVTFE